MSDTTEKPQFWPILRAAFIALNRAYLPAVEEAARARRIESPAWQYLLYILVFKDEPLSVSAIRVRGPYTSARLFAERFEMLSKLGFLSRQAPGRTQELSEPQEPRYLPTKGGLSAARSFLHTARAAMAGLAPLPPAELERLALLLERVVNASLKTPAPLDGWSVRHSMNLDPGPGTDVVARIDQYFSDLAAYRDDCHISSWRGHGIDGHAWEILTLVWRKQADSLAALREALKHRGFSEEETIRALQELLDRGWVEGTAVRYSATAVGSDVRQTAQYTTDALFNAPFACLNNTEQEELATVLEKLSQAFRPPGG